MPRARTTISALYQLGRIAQEERRYDEADANYRRALDIKLEYGDQHSAASTYHQLGRIAHEQERWDEAEANYRKALDIYRESDRRAASVTASQLGGLLAALGRHPEAVRTFLYAVVTWRQETGRWDREDLQGLRQVRTVIGGDEFTDFVTADLTGDLVQELMTAMDAADRSDDTGEPGSGDDGVTS